MFGKILAVIAIATVGALWSYATPSDGKPRRPASAAEMNNAMPAEQLPLPPARMRVDSTPVVAKR